MLDPRLLAFQRICGRVVKTDGVTGKDLPVPFATVTVYDVDFWFLAWSAPGSMYSWFCPCLIRREKLATVTTDECGRFCVCVLNFDIDFYLRWRLERRCYLTWLRKPTIEDVLRAHEVIPRPQPDPGPIRLDEHVLAHAARVIDTSAVTRLREVATLPHIGAPLLENSDALTRAAFPVQTRPPLTREAAEILAPAMRAKLAARVGVPVASLEKLDPSRWIGPFIRCRDVLIPQWKLVVDVPDLSFEVTQDVNGDGSQEVIYRDRLFDVRWDMKVGDVTLHADATALAGVSCDIHDVGPCGDPGILAASNYPLQGGYYDPATGFATQPNRPDVDGFPGGARGDVAQAPFTDPFYLVGCAERPDATHYRVHHQVQGGPTTYLNGSYGPLLKVVGGTLFQKVVSPVDGQWYPIIPRADGWTPVGILAPVAEGGDHLHTFKLEFGKPSSGGAITAMANSQTAAVHLTIDTTPPSIEFLGLRWRHPDASLNWQSLPLTSSTECPVIHRASNALIQIHLSLRVSADHLRDFTVTPVGCGDQVSPPQLITDGRNGLPKIDENTQANNGPAHWYTDKDDNSQTRDLYWHDGSTAGSTDAEPAVQLARLCDDLAAGSHAELVYVNLTSPELAALGLYTARAVIPGMQPIDFGWPERRLGGARLRDLPAALGLRAGPLELDAINDDPHPIA